MTSPLRLQSSFAPFIAPTTTTTTTTIRPSSTPSPAKKQTMSLTQTYYIASTARSKLGREAGRADHDLRLLVGHANLLDTLMVELADAEREQEAWFRQSVKKAATPEEPRHVRWIDTVVEDEDEDDDNDSDLESDDGSDIYDEDADMFNIPLRRIRSPPVEISSEEIDEDMESDDEFDDQDLSLSRVPSHTSHISHSPPELTLDGDSDSEDDLPTSPEQTLFELSEKERRQITTTTFYDDIKPAEALLSRQHQQPMIAAC